MELLTVNEAAERIGVTPKAVYYQINHGKFTRHTEYGKVLVDATEVSRYIPRKRSTRISGPLKGYGLLAGKPGGTQTFMARKAAEKALER